MDHDLYRFSPIPARSGAFLGEGVRVAVYLLLHVEHNELTPPPGTRRDPRFAGEFGDFSPPYRAWSTREYGNRVGLFRVLEAIDRHGLPASVAMNAFAAQGCPALVDACRARGMELVGHGLSSARMLHAQMDEAEEREHIALSLGLLAQAWGVQPQGWAGQDFGATARTSRLLAEAGITYSLDWPNDELPYWQADGRLEAIPSFPDWDDVELLWLRRMAAPRYPRLVAEAVAQLAREGTPRVFGIGLHPWVIGMPHHIRYLREALDQLRGMPGVAFMTCGEIARRFAGSLPAAQA